MPARKRYSRLYHLDQDGDLAPRPYSAGKRKITYSERSNRGWFLWLLPMPNLRGQQPPGVPRRCVKHRGGRLNKSCPDCLLDLAAEAAAVTEFEKIVGFTNLPAGAGQGKYTRNRPLEKSNSTCSIELNRVKSAKDGAHRLMATDVWMCVVCRSLWVNTTPRCPTCGQPRGRRQPLKAAIKKNRSKYNEV